MHRCSVEFWVLLAVWVGIWVTILDWYGHNLGDSVNLRQNLLQGGDKSQEMPAWPGPCQWRIRG